MNENTPYSAPSSASDCPKRHRGKIFRLSSYWILVVLAYALLAAVWYWQVSLLGFGTMMSNVHARNDSEGGAFFWFLLSKAAQIAFLGWHAVPFALCSGAMLIRRSEPLLTRWLHAGLFWGSLVSFLAALALLWIG